LEAILKCLTDSYFSLSFSYGVWYFILINIDDRILSALILLIVFKLKSLIFCVIFSIFSFFSSLFTHYFIGIIAVLVSLVRSIISPCSLALSSLIVLFRIILRKCLSSMQINSFRSCHPNNYSNKTLLCTRICLIL